MSVETWFRGEGVGVAPATPGSTAPHDLGDGMYLSDSQDVAASYAAERSPTPAARRLYAVDLDLRRYRVLDLTTDARWQRHMRPPAPGMPSPELALRQTNENYGRMFSQFVAQHRIDLSQYDIVIGREYVRGGRQLCVLFKNGRPSALQDAIRANFRVVLTAAATPTRIPAGALALRGRIGPGLRTAGAAAGVIAITALLSYLLGRIRQEEAEAELRRLEPAITAAVYRHVEDVAELLMGGRTPYANVTVEIVTTVAVDTPGALGYVPDPLPLIPTYRLQQVAVSDQNVSTSNSVRTFGLGFYTDTATHVYSLPLMLSREEVELYRAYRLELQWYDEIMRGSLAREDLMRLVNARNALMERFANAVTRVPPS